MTKPDGRKLHLYSYKPLSENISPTNPRHGDFNPSPHQRWHPLRKEWIIYAPYRQDRTFLPPKDHSPLAVTTSRDFPTELPEGEYDVAVFENLYPSLNLTTEEQPGLYVPTQPSKGVCEVVVFTQNPETSLGQLSCEKIELILRVIAERTKELSKNGLIQYVLPFENKGVEMGVTLHHPHGQIYSYPFIPPVQERFLESMKEHWTKNKNSLIESIIENEKAEARRVIDENETIICFIPAFARYPYETWIVPKRRMSFLYDLTDKEFKDLSYLLKKVLLKFDKLWNRPFPYLMTINQAPVKGDFPFAHLFFQITPPYRSKDKLKFLAGTELGAGVFVNDSLPEDKAEELKKVEVNFHEND